MKMKEIYETAIKIGMDNDWRGRNCLDEIFKKAQEDADKPGFDKDRLFNPYGDTRIACGDPETEIKSILVGIDIGPSEVLLAGQMRQMGKPVDLCLSHHTTCINRGLYFFEDILLSHKYSLAEVGVDENKYNPIVDLWISEVSSIRKWKMDTINTAVNLDISLMNIHTPCDLMHIANTRRVFEQMKDAGLGEIAQKLNNIEELKQHPFDSVMIHGNSKRKPGKVYNPTGAGWRPLIELFELACQANIDTAVLVCPTEEYFKMAEKYNVTIVELPHDSNDNFGINLMIDELEKVGGPLKIYSAHNFKRICRTY